MNVTEFYSRLPENCAHVEENGSSIKETIKLKEGVNVHLQTITELYKHLPYMSRNVISTDNKPVLVISKPPAQSIQERLESAEDGEGEPSEECIGSPLKLQSLVDYADVDRQIKQNTDKIRVLHKDRLSLYPLPPKFARQCLSAVTVKGNSTVFCVCDPHATKDKSILIGQYKHQSGSQRLLSVTYQEMKSLDAVEKYQKIVKDHRRILPSSSKIEHTEVHAEYNLMSLSSTDLTEQICGDVDVFSSNSSIKISCDWGSVDRLMMTPPTDSTATVTVNVICGDKSSVVYSLYEQLQYIKELTNGLSSGRITWPDLERSCTPLEKCAALLQSSTNYEQQCEPTSAAPIHTINISSLEERKNLDFTDQLWTVLSDCQSYSELVEILGFVIKSVTEKKCPPLMVSSSNTNSLAKWIHAHQTGGDMTGSDLELGGLQSIIYFIEIGLEKLTKDYIHCYLGNFSGLVTADKLTKLTRKCTLQERLTNLSKLHSVLELSALLSGYLRLPVATVRSSTATALRYIEENPSLPAEGYELTTTVSTVSHVINSQSADLWTAQLGDERCGNFTEIRITKTEPEHCVILQSPHADRSNDDDIFYCTVSTNTEIDCTALSG